MVSDLSTKYAEKTGMLRGTMSWVALYEDISDEAFKKLARCLIEVGEEGDVLDDQTKGWLMEAAQKRGITIIIMGYPFIKESCIKHSREVVEEHISKLQPLNYNQFRWWRTHTDNVKLTWVNVHHLKIVLQMVTLNHLLIFGWPNMLCILQKIKLILKQMIIKNN